MRKTVFALMAMVLMVLTAGCSKEDPQQKELTLEVSGITDNSAILNCIFTSTKSASYQVCIGDAISEEYSENMKFSIVNLTSGKKHTVVAKIFDSNHKQVGTAEVEFKTTGTSDDVIRKEIILPLGSEQFSMTLSDDNPEFSMTIDDTPDIPNSVTVTCWYWSYKMYGYSLSCDKGGVFSETGKFVKSKRLTLSNLIPGVEYTITVTFYLPMGITIDAKVEFTKK